ncbi:hypothetical protein POTOM_009029 [Populus tomentosa]|uniref:SAM domain-containing protein n=1 Tax=Populus tomentosa TaxID=118781 RepID=A0A8X8AU44_POPTO|nr:hypothetical protein POTOM_009029 [Populus tomentosa]
MFRCALFRRTFSILNEVLESCELVILCLNNYEPETDSSVDGFLQSLGLEKYLITFQAEEVDMTALVHMNDEDLKALGIPMDSDREIISEISYSGNCLMSSFRLLFKTYPNLLSSF